MFITPFIHRHRRLKPTPASSATSESARKMAQLAEKDCKFSEEAIGGWDRIVDCKPYRGCAIILREEECGRFYTVVDYDDYVERWITERVFSAEQAMAAAKCFVDAENDKYQRPSAGLAERVYAILMGFLEA